MFVFATAIPFTEDALRNLKVGEKVQVSSGMGGSYTLSVKDIKDTGIEMNPHNSLPYDLTYKWPEAKEMFFLLMPSSEYGIYPKHVAIAKQAGHSTLDDIASAIATYTGETISLVKHYITNNTLL